MSGYNPQGETWEKRQERERRNQREQNFRELCPILYRETDTARLPNRAAYRKVMAWKFGARGLLLVGETGRGKTRSAWKLLDRLYLAEERSLRTLDAAGVQLGVAREWGKPDTAERWVEKLCAVDVLFLDDLDKVKFTEAAALAIYTIFERRPANGRPIIATLNQRGDDLVARLTVNERGEQFPGCGAAIVRRMREFCELVEF
jgi:DNA replication protein DnaC